MKTRIIKGDAVKDRILNEVKMELLTLQNQNKTVPGIAFVGFLNVPLGKYNIPYHVGLANELGFKVINEIQPDGTTENELFELIDKLNEDKDVHAIEVLQPLPAYLNPLRIVNRINPEKEMEGFHPANILKTMFPDIQENKFEMCLPAALNEIFKESVIHVNAGDEWVLVLDDEFFENPLVNMVTRSAFMKAVPFDCPLTIVNSNSSKIESLCKTADYLVVVTKKPCFILPEWLKPGVFIIDIYSNLLKEIPSKKDPEKLLPVIRGGVDVETVKNIAGAIIPIPGGLMSVVLVIMFRNLINAFKNSMPATFA